MKDLTIRRIILPFSAVLIVAALLLAAGSLKTNAPADNAAHKVDRQMLIEELESLRASLADEEKDAQARIDDAVGRIDALLARIEGNGRDSRRSLIADPQGDPFSDPFFGDSPFGPDWNPYAEMQRMEELTDRLFNNAFRRFQQSPRYGGLARGPAFSPSMDLSETDENYVVQADVPGLDRSNISVEVKNRVLTISGERQETVEEQDSQGQFLRQERRIGHFQRSVALPGPVKEDQVKAEYEEGVLKITLPKAETEDQETHEVIVK